MSDKKKILEISSYPPPRAGWGVRVEFVKKELEKQGHVCEVLNIAPESRKIPGNEYLTAQHGFDYIFKIIGRVIRGYRVHMHMNGDSPKGFILTLIALGLSFFLFRRADLTFHAGPYQKYFPQERAPKLTLMYRIIFRLARNIICNSEPVKEKISGYGISAKKIFAIQAFSRQYLQYKPVEFNGVIGKFLAEGRPLITSYVFFRPEFFIEQMIDAMAELKQSHPSFRLLILGSADHSKAIQEQIKKLDLQTHVHIAGDQDHDNFLTLLAKSDIFLRTPVKDGVSSSVLEALSLGTAVVASENGTRPASVITYSNNDFLQMVATLRKSIDNKNELQKKIIVPEICDTVRDEINVLIGD